MDQIINQQIIQLNQVMNLKKIEIRNNLNKNIWIYNPNWDSKHYISVFEMNIKIIITSL